MFVDSHCHLDKLNYQELHTDLADVLAKAEQAKVKALLSVSVALDAFPAMREMIEPYDHVYASCGVHPLYVDKTDSLAPLREYARDPKVIAIGETGLDYHYQPEGAEYQQESFRQHVDLAVELNKPLIIHTRNAREDTLRILREGGAERCGGVIHCFTEDWAFAQAAMGLGFYISISGIVTFRTAKELREVVKQLPLDRLLIETDSPYLAPVPYRGKENQPAYVAEVAACVAELKGVSVEEIAQQTTQNFETLFLR